MRVYRTKCDWHDEQLEVPSMTIYETERGWQKTGLLDHLGNELFANDQHEPIGFVVDFSRPSKKRGRK